MPSSFFYKFPIIIIVVTMSITPITSRLSYHIREQIPKNERSIRSISTSTICYRNTPVRRPRDPLEQASNAVRHAIPTGETFIVRPPPSAESPYNLKSSQQQTTVVYPTSAHVLPPALSPNRSDIKGEKEMSAESIQAIREMRATDPFENTASKLAKKFGCSPAFVQIVAPVNKEVRIVKQKEIEIKKANWGANKTMQRQLRQERKSLW
jgi:hypothetical protein